MDVNDVTSKSNPAEPHKFATLMNLILVVAVMIIMIQRQIMRFSLKSKTDQHAPICYNAPKKMKEEAKRRLYRTVDIGHKPTLLHSDAMTHSTTATNTESIPYLHRMKALHACKLLETKLAKDKSFSYNAPEGFDVFLRNNIHLFPLQQTRIDEFYSLYRHARHEPKPFGKADHDRMVLIITEMTNVVQGARRRTIQMRNIRPIADIDEITDEALPSVSRAPSSQFKLPIRDAVIGLAGKVFKKSKSKQDYQSVPSTESMDDINETTQL